MLYIAADHAGYPLKEELKLFMEEMGVEFEDLGNEQLDPSDDYPDFAYRLAHHVLDNEDSKGILICGTGAGMCIAANKVDGIRAALVHDDFTARDAAEHLNANVICLGGRVTDFETGKKLVKMWLETEFSGDERHLRRFEKIQNIERS
jgi:ribose 5-phosphate isomerase B